MTWRIRGGQTVPVVLGSARLSVSAHQQQRWVVALKDPGEEDDRYRVASEMSGRAVDVASAYPLRGRVEVFFADGKLSEGGGQLAPQWDAEGSSRGLTLSLLLWTTPFSFTPNNEPASRTTCRRVPSVACNSNPGWTHGST